MSIRRILLLVTLLGLLAGGCAASDQPAILVSAPAASEGERTLSPPSTSTPAPTATPEPAAATELAATPKATVTPDPTATPEPNPFTDLVQPLPAAPIGSAAGLIPIPGPAPTGLRVAAIGVESAPVVSVGVNPDRTFEVPAREEVGWYEFGVSPGESGSAVLAAHIAFDGVDGVFRHLEDLNAGDVVDISFDDGSEQSFMIESVTEYNKQALPDSLFARDGRTQIALITCGGNFNRQLNSYESNTVAIAVPVNPVPVNSASG